MRLVIDANVIMAMLIKPGKPIDILFHAELEAFAPSLLFLELENNRATILRKSKLSEGEVDALFEILKQKITVVPEQEFLKYREEANSVCPDPKDIIYFALAVYLNCPIWTNEKKLKAQSRVEVYDTSELMKLFEI